MADGKLAALGTWCYRRRWWVLLAWLGLVVAGVLASGPVFAGMERASQPDDVESIQAYDALSDGDTDGGQVVGLVDRVQPQAAGVAPVIRAAAADIAGMTGVRQVGHPYDGGQAQAGGHLARDGTALLLTVDLAKQDDREVESALIDRVGARLDQLDAELADAGQGPATVRLGGWPVLDREANEVVEADMQRAELIALPITLIVLVLVFGGLVVAGLPVLAAVVSVASAMSMLLGFAQFTDLNSNVVTVVTLLGLGLSVDYGLLLVARYREERLLGYEPVVAVGRAWATAGRTILFSALGIAFALGGLLMFDISDLAALGAAGISIAVVSMLAGLTFTAGLIGVLHKRVDPSRRVRARAGRRAAASPTGDADGNGEHGFFAGLARAVQRRPLLVALGTTALLLAAASPLLATTLRMPDLEQMPRSLESVQVADALTERFGRSVSRGVTVVARTDTATLDDWGRRWTDDPAVRDVEPAQQAGPGLATLDLNLTGDPQGEESRALVERLRDDRPTGGESWVTGDPAVLTDLLNVIKSGLPGALGVTLGAMFLLLFLFTGSFVIPVKAILANVVSLGATFGVLNAVFERGFLAGPLDTITVGALDPFVIVITFAFAFGLSMDYEVFLLGRVKEYVDAGVDTDTAVRRGLQHTGRIITSAALLMIIVFGGFAAARMGQIEQIGLALAVAVFIDATIVRCLLVPAAMTLLGRWNWWAPAWAKSLHRRIGLQERVLPTGPADRPAGPDAAAEQLAGVH